jgi:transcriptional regulator
MYNLSHFTPDDPERVISFMKENSFAVVTAIGDRYPVATHLPLSVNVAEDGNITFQGHLMKNTDHHKAFEKNGDVLVIFNGPHCYVSASWYQQPQAASTWNYMTVHAKGKIRFTDEEGTHQAVRAITDKYEGTDSPASFQHLPEAYVRKLLKAIVGFTIEVEAVEHVFKLSQNHSPENRQSISNHLKLAGNEQSAAIAREMDKS